MPRLTRPCLLMRLTLLSLAGAISAPLFQGHAEESSNILHWRNGDQLQGNLSEIHPDSIRWSAMPFRSDLDLSIDQLRSIEFDTEETEETEVAPAPFRLLLTNGDKLFGALESISNQTITLRTAPFKEAVQVDFAHVASLVHQGSKHVLYSGPDNLARWIPIGGNKSHAEWFHAPSGALGTSQWASGMSRKIRFPSMVEVSFDLYFPHQYPHFIARFTRSVEFGPRIETWGNTLVLSHGNRFTSAGELSESQQHLTLRLFWDLDSGQVLLCDASGRQLASLDGVILEKQRLKHRNLSGFYLTSRTLELQVTDLSVHRWNGQAPPVIDTERPRILLSGEPPNFNTKNISYRKGDHHLRIGSRSHPLDAFRELILNPPTSSAESETWSHISWTDGSTARGTIVPSKANHIALSVPWSRSPLPLQFDTAREFHFPHSDSPISRSHYQAKGENFDLHGTIRLFEDPIETGLVGWLPPGSSTPVPFAKAVHAHITRIAHNESAAPIEQENFQARLYLTNEEIITGRLVSIDSDSVKFESRLSGAIELPSDHIRAIDLGSRHREFTGFTDRNWVKTKDAETDVTIAGNEATFRKGGLGNPTLLLGDLIRFSLQWNQSFGAMTLRLFTGIEGENGPSSDIILAAQGKRVFIAPLSTDGNFSFSGDQIPLENNRAEFEVRILAKTIEVTVDQHQAISIPFDASKVTGNGLYFVHGGGWRGWNQADSEIILSDFQIDQSPGVNPLRVISPPSKEMALRLPRSRRDPIPTHLLLAPNGDLLRGRLLAASESEVHFDSRGTELTLPTSRVSAIIWLSPPPIEPTTSDETKPPADKPRFQVTHQIKLTDGSRLNLHAKHAKKQRLIGTSSLLGECQVPIHQLWEMTWHPQTPVSELKHIEEAHFANWILSPTPEPNILTEQETPPSPLIGTAAPAFKLSMLDQSTFDLKEHQGKVVVLDFWATWCGPCIKAIPEVRNIVGRFPSDQVKLCLVNQSEPLPIINQFLKSRGWKDAPVGLDFNTSVSKSYEVKGLPFTVVINKKGKISWVHSGYSEHLSEQLFNAIGSALKQ